MTEQELMVAFEELAAALAEPTDFGVTIEVSREFSPYATRAIIEAFHRIKTEDGERHVLEDNGD